MKLAIMVCEKVTHICSATACFNAFNKREKAFNRYKGKDVEIAALFHCNGCKNELESNLRDKIKQLKNNNIEIVHMAKCIEVECNRYEEISKFMKENKFVIEYGTH